MQSSSNAKTPKKIAKPFLFLWFLAALGLASTCFAVWGVWRVTDQTVNFQSRDDRALILAVSLKEQIASFSKLTYDFLLQQDFNRMLMKEKQSDKIRDEVTTTVASLVALSVPETSAGIENIRYNVLQFMVLTDKALETAAEEGAGGKARGILQDEVEPELRKAQGAINDLIAARSKINEEHFKAVRQQSLEMMLLLVGIAALALALALYVRVHILHLVKEKTRQSEASGDRMAALALPVLLQTQDGLVIVPTNEPATQSNPPPIQLPVLQPSAPSLPVPALTAKGKGRVMAETEIMAWKHALEKVRHDSGDMKKLLQSVHDFIEAKMHAKAEAGQVYNIPQIEQDMNQLMMQGEKISKAVSRVGHVHDQSKQFMESLNELMRSLQGLATEGNMVALNVTIEMAKLQAKIHEPSAQQAAHEEKNMRISEQIRLLATSAAGITGKMAMLLSQFRYSQEDFGKQVVELTQLKDFGATALSHIKETLQQQEQRANSLFAAQEGLTGHMPLLNQKMAELEEQLQQLEALGEGGLEEDLEPRLELQGKRSFKVITGGAA